jgi:hypothetical protein
MRRAPAAQPGGSHFRRWLSPGGQQRIGEMNEWGGDCER